MLAHGFVTLVEKDFSAAVPAVALLAAAMLFAIWAAWRAGVL